MGTYVPFSKAEFESFLTENKVPFVHRHIPGTLEHVYDVPLTLKSGVSYPAMIRIHSSIQIGDDMTRSVGSDAIRMQLFRTEPESRSERFPDGRPVKDAVMKCFRTKNALPTTVEKLRDLFKQGVRQMCPDCNVLMVKRGKEPNAFYGCATFPKCRKTKNVKVVENGN